MGAFLVGLLLGGCWKTTDFATLPQTDIAFAPSSGDAPDGWVITSIEMPIACPDRTNSNFYLLYPEEDRVSDTGTSTPPALPVALLLHSGTFDYVATPSAADALSGPHYQSESRLEYPWAVRRVFYTLGMYADAGEKVEESNGALASALANQGVAVLIPGNCWGDLWHNSSLQLNEVELDRFNRFGLDASTFGWKALTDPTFAAGLGLTLPINIDTKHLYMVGLGEGGRGVGELLNAGYKPQGVLVDSPADDLRPIWEDPTQAAYNNGLQRIYYTNGETETLTGSLSNVPLLPPATVFLYSSIDPEVPASTEAAFIQRHGADPNVTVVDFASTGVAGHVFTTNDATTAGNAVALMLGGSAPADTDTDTAAP